MNRKVKNSRKGGANMLYQSLVEVRKNIEALERKNHYKSKKILWSCKYFAGIFNFFHNLYTNL